MMIAALSTSSHAITDGAVTASAEDKPAAAVRVAASGVDGPRPSTKVPGNPALQLAPPVRRVNIPQTVADASDAIDQGQAKRALMLLASIDPELEVARQAIRNILGNCDCEQEEFERLSNTKTPGPALQYVREADRLRTIARQLDVLQFIIEQQSRPTAELTDALAQLERKNSETFIEGRNSDHQAFRSAIASVQRRIAEAKPK